VDPGTAGGQIANKSGLGNARRKQDLDDRGLTKLLQFVVTSGRAPKNKQHKLLGLLAVSNPHGLNAARAAGRAGYPCLLLGELAEYLLAKLHKSVV